MPEGGLADIGARTAVHRQPIAVLAHDLHGALPGSSLLGQQSAESGGVRAADCHAGPQPGAGEVCGLLVGDKPARLQRDDLICGLRGLSGVVRGEQDRATLRGVRTQETVQPPAFAGGQAVGGGVEDKGVRIGQQRAGQTEAAVHAARKGAQAFVAQADKTDHLEDFIGTADRDAGGGAQHTELTAHRAGGVTGDIAEQDAHFARGMGDAVQRAAPEVGDATALLEFEHEPERRRLARARGSEERGDTARVRLEGHIVDDGRKVLAGVAGQSDRLDHPKQDSAICPVFRAPEGLLRTPASQRPDSALSVRALLGFQTSGRSIGGLSSVAPPARKSWAGRPPWRVVVPPVGTRKPGVPVTLRWKLRGSSATPHTAS